MDTSIQLASHDSKGRDMKDIMKDLLTLICTISCVLYIMFSFINLDRLDLATAFAIVLICLVFRHFED